MFCVEGLTHLTELNLKWLGPVCLICFAVLAVHIWRRRWMYYYGYKLPGSFGSQFNLFKRGEGDIYNFLTELYKTHPSVFKMCFGSDIYFTTTEPAHLKIVLTRFLHKGNFYHLMIDYFQRALAAAPLEWWKTSRKNVNPTFHVSLINSFVEPFAKQANALADRLEEYCGRESDDIFPMMWKCTMDAACETLAEVDPTLIRTEKYLPDIFRLEDILQRRFFNPFLHLNIFWYFSSARQELIRIWRQNCSCIQQIMDLMKSSKETENVDKPRKKGFLKHLMHLIDSKVVPHDYVLEEGQIIFFVGTETSAVALSSTLLMLGMHPEIQEKINDELFSIFANSSRDPTLEDVNKMEYLERVLKESMRLLPPIPFILREVDEDLQLDSCFVPAKCKVIIPIAVVHRKPELWPNPLEFDPDRFLPEEAEKRPSCAYIPFSYGVRNCIGNKYGMLSMKVILSTVLRRYRISSSNYEKLADIDFFVHVIAKAKRGYRVTLERK